MFEPLAWSREATNQQTGQETRVHHNASLQQSLLEQRAKLAQQTQELQQELRSLAGLIADKQTALQVQPCPSMRSHRHIIAAICRLDPDPDPDPDPPRHRLPRRY